MKTDILKDDTLLTALILKAKLGDEDSFIQLLSLFEKIIYNICKNYFLPGADKEDLIQFGRIGLLKGVRSFKEGYEQRPKHFINMCIEREIITGVKTYSRNKHKFLNERVTANTLLKKLKDDDMDVEDFINDPNVNIEYELIEKESKFEINKIVSKLTGIQYNCFSLYLEGYKQREISKLLNLNIKQVDNALYRAKNNLKHILNEIGGYR